MTNHYFCRRPVFAQGFDPTRRPDKLTRIYSNFLKSDAKSVRFNRPKAGSFTSFTATQYGETAKSFEFPV